MTVFTLPDPAKLRSLELEPVVMDEEAPRTKGPAQIIRRQGDRWTAVLQTVPITDETAIEWQNLIAKLAADRANNRLRVYDHRYDGPGGAVALAAFGTPRVAGAGQRGTQLAVDGLPTGALCFAEGDLVGYDNGTFQTMHRVMADVVSSAGGAATIDILPRIPVPPPDNALLIIDQPAADMYLKSVDEQPVEDQRFHIMLTLSLEEAHR